LQGQIVIRAVENVTNQAAQVTQAVKEQAAGVEEIIKSVADAREQVRQITAAVKEQAKQDRILPHLFKMSANRRLL